MWGVEAEDAAAHAAQTVSEGDAGLVGTVEEQAELVAGAVARGEDEGVRRVTGRAAPADLPASSGRVDESLAVVERCAGASGVEDRTARLTYPR